MSPYKFSLTYGSQVILAMVRGSISLLAQAKEGLPLHHAIM